MLERKKKVIKYVIDVYRIKYLIQTSLRILSAT